jgi:hypothetical protein
MNGVNEIKSLNTFYIAVNAENFFPFLINLNSMHNVHFVPLFLNFKPSPVIKAGTFQFN